jgi:hypothetical protein
MFSGRVSRRQVTENDDAVETMVYEAQQAAEQPRKFFHRFSPPVRMSRHREHGTEGRWRSKPKAPQNDHVGTEAARAFITRDQAGGAEISSTFG